MLLCIKDLIFLGIGAYAAYAFNTPYKFAEQQSNNNEDYEVLILYYRDS